MGLSLTYTMWFSINFLQPLKSTRRSRGEKEGKWNYNFLCVLQFKERKKEQVHEANIDFEESAIKFNKYLIFDPIAESRYSVPWGPRRFFLLSFTINAFNIAINESFKTIFRQSAGNFQSPLACSPNMKTYQSDGYEENGFNTIMLAFEPNSFA